MITRVVRVKIDPSMRTEFESVFADIPVKAVKARHGFLSMQIGKPSQWSPDEYLMITRWKNEQALRAFVGESWNEVLIPNGMDRFVRECWVHHYTDYRGI